jgi:tetratricopeptide (TPR) repeat protein
MNALKSLNKEQWTALVALVWGGGMILLGGVGGGAGGQDLPNLVPDRSYEPVKSRGLELPDDKFERYWQGKDVFKAEASAKLAIPPLKAPEPREEELPAFPFRPFPEFEAYNGLQVAPKYPTLAPGQPVIAEANLPPAAEVEALRKAEEPAAPPRPDRRLDRLREFLQITTNSGAKFEGKEVSVDTDEQIVFRDKNGQRVTLKKSDIRVYLPNRTYQEEYKVRASKITPGPREADERFKLAQQALEWGMLPETLQELRDALAAKKDHLDATLLLGQLAVEGADFEGALAAYRSALDAGAAPAELHNEVGRSLQALGFHEGAAAAFEKAVEAQPRHVKARLGLVRSQIELGAPKAAVEGVNDLFTRVAGVPEFNAAARAEAHFLRALGQFRQGALEKARADLAEALKAEPPAAEAVNALGALNAVEGKYPQAVPEFLRAIRLNPYLTEAWTNLGGIYLLAGKWTEAEGVFAAALQRDPASVEAALGQGVAQFLAGKKEAPASLDRAAAMDPRSLLVQIVSGHLKLREGADEDALARFTDALRTDFHYLPAYSGAAAAYLRTARKLASGAPDEARDRKAQELRVNAETLIRALRDFDPNRASYWALLGSCYAVTGRADEARLALRQATALASQTQRPVDPFVLYTAGYLEYYHGQAETDAGRLELAQREFAQAVKLKGQFTDAYTQRVIADCENAADGIEQWKTTVVRVDERFEGESAKTIGLGWIEADDRNGVAITREYSKEKGGRGKFAGTHVARDWALTSLTREIPGGDFHSLEITFMPEKAEKVEFGVSLYTAHQGETWSGFHLGFDGAGKVRYVPGLSDKEMDGRDMSVGWVELKGLPPNPKEITLRLAMVEKGRQSSLALSWWDAAKREWTPSQKEIPLNLGGGRGNWRVQAWARAWKSQEVLLYVDNFRVFGRERR